MNLFRRLLLRNRQTPPDGTLTYEQAKELARSDDPEVRRRLAARADIVPEILYYLAEDPAPEVRREIAANRATPAQANLVLATDADIAVRSSVAEKIARLVPDLDAEELDRLRRVTHEALQLLARDQVARVRQLLAEALKDVAHAPPEVIRRLARDAELAVSGPVLEFSPVLTDEDLIEIIAAGPQAGALSAISRRAEVAAPVADAIAASDDASAIAMLLANPSAQIREETLDRLIDRAPEIEAWHGPLVRRPRLSPAAAGRLAAFVADNLVQTLTQRHDLDPDTAAAVSAAVHRRLADGRAPAPRPARAEEPAGGALGAARALHASGRLDDAAVADALALGERDFALAALAVRADLPLDVVHKVIVTQSPKGVVSLAWKAGLDPALAVPLQTKLARIPPGEVIAPHKDGYPMGAEEMAWQIKFFASLTGEPT